ncbi:MAG: SLC13 family permease [Dehalococcoidales bacterium]|nr:SLC13 family permease [Dehalococcoidales bacterium]
MDQEIILVLIVLAITAILLVIDIIRIDIVAILCMLTLGWTGVLEPLETLEGFSSNAVISMVAVMFMGRGIASTGVMDKLSRFIINTVGNSESRIVVTVSSTVGLLSGFIQNVGAAVLFLPSLLNISRRQKIPVSRLIMPVGFAAILGGALTLIGSSPMLLVNDFLVNSSLKRYMLFSVTPVGLAILFSGIALFYFFGKYLLPKTSPDKTSISSQQKIIDQWHLPYIVWHYLIPSGSRLEGLLIEESGIWKNYNINILAISRGKIMEYAPWRETRFESGQTIALMGYEPDVQRFATDYGLVQGTRKGTLQVVEDPVSTGFAEILVPPNSQIVGQTLREFNIRRRYKIEPILLFHKGERIPGDFSDIEISAGDIFVAHGLWESYAALKKSSDFHMITLIETVDQNKSKTWVALFCFLLAIGLAMAGFTISLAFLTGAMGMILTRVISIDDAYKSIDWKVIFFVAGLIPLGIAMQKSGTAEYLATSIMSLIQGSHVLIILFSITLISTVFSLFMSNVAATVIMAPLVINMGQIAGIDPRPLVLLVAISSGNSFILPTHQVNALFKTPGGYRNLDYLRAGGILTILFTVVAVLFFYFFYV